MTELQHQKKIRNPRSLVIHYSAMSPPVVEPYRKAWLSEYIAAGFFACRNRAGDEIHLLHPNAHYGAHA